MVSASTILSLAVICIPVLMSATQSLQAAQIVPRTLARQERRVSKSGCIAEQRIDKMIDAQPWIQMSRDGRYITLRNGQSYRYQRRNCWLELAFRQTAASTVPPRIKKPIPAGSGVEE